MKLGSLLAGVALCVTSSAFAVSSLLHCRDLLSIPEIAYLQDLQDQRLIDERHLGRLAEDLSRGVVTNPILPEEAVVAGRAWIHRQGLQAYLRPGLSESQRMELKGWLQFSLKTESAARGERNQIQAETLETYSKMEFHQIDAPVTFYSSAFGQLSQVALTSSFELMATHVTQWQWARLMETNPSCFGTYPRPVPIHIGQQTIQIQPNLPVNNVSWDDVQRLTQRMDRMSIEDDSRLYELIPDHRKGDRYRLPTLAEWECVMSHQDQDVRRNVEESAWFVENSGGQPHEVGDLKPLIYESGKRFFDLTGNVRQWLEDWYTSVRYDEREQVDPRGPAQGINRALVGGDFTSDRFMFLGPPMVTYALPGWSGITAGFRLVRVRLLR